MPEQADYFKEFEESCRTINKLIPKFISVEPQAFLTSRDIKEIVELMRMNEEFAHVMTETAQMTAKTLQYLAKGNKKAAMQLYTSSAPAYLAEFYRVLKEDETLKRYYMASDAITKFHGLWDIVDYLVPHPKTYKNRG